MDIKRLTHFMALAEEGRFALAAARVHLSQAAFSRSIQSLEERMGLKLFDRGAKGAKLTPAGAIVLQRAQTLVFDSRCLQRDIELVRQGDVGEISIGAAPIPAATLIPDLLCELQKHSPRLCTRVQMGKLSRLLEQLDSQEIDFCLGDPRLIMKSPRHEMLHIGKNMGGLYSRRAHPLARKGTASKDDVQRYGVALISTTPMLLQNLATSLGFESSSEFPMAVECDDIHTLTHLVSQTDVLGILPKAIANQHPKALKLLQTQTQEHQFADIYAIWLKGRTLAPSAKQAIQMVQRISKAQLKPSA